MESTFALPLPSLSTFAPPPQPATIKMEDLETHGSSDCLSLATLDDGSAPSPSAATSPSPEQKGTKKRRSWGQVLPEPKTNLPPRKRAKTADEKEQRRIERVKRNRLAAHNSRERKRQEVEALQVQNQDLEDQLARIREIATQQEAQLRYFRNLCPDAAAGAPFGSLQADLAVTLHKSPFDSLTAAASGSTPATSSSSVHNGTASPGLPNLSSSSVNATPDSLAHTIDSFSMPSTPSAEDSFGADLTQHSAAMLCLDLQCQSAPTAAPSSAEATVISTAASPFSQASAMIFSLLILTSLTVSSATSAAISAFLTVTRYFPRRLTSPSTLRSLCRPPSSTRSPRTTASTPQTMWADLLMACLPIRSPAQAQHFLLATSLALRRSDGLKSSAPRRSDALAPDVFGGLGRQGLEARFRVLLAARRRRRAIRSRAGTREATDDLGGPVRTQ